MSTIAPTTSSTSGTSVGNTTPATFDNSTFLKLLTAQLQNQTPLEPVDNQSFMQQMTSYSTMEEQQQLNTNMLKLLDYQGVLARVQSLGQGSALLGKTVSYNDDNGNQQSGKVTSVFVDNNGNVRVKLDGGNDIDMRSVTGIADAAAASS